jgi:hypothetical protein
VSHLRGCQSTNVDRLQDGLRHAATHSVEQAVADDPADEHAVRRDVARKVQIQAARIKFRQVNCA